MKKQSLVFLAAALSIAFLFAVVYAAQEAPETVTMENKVFDKHTKALVTFSHKKHSAEYKVACADCHHVYTDGKNTWKEGDAVQKCTECHKEAKMPQGEKLTKEEKIKKYYYDAVHENCVGCHKAEKKKGKEAIPTKCTDCHPAPAK